MSWINRADIHLFMTGKPGKWLLFFSSWDKASIFFELRAHTSMVGVASLPVPAATMAKGVLNCLEPLF